MLTILLLVSMAASGGCAATPDDATSAWTPDQPDAPLDFSIDLTILEGDAVDPAPAAHRRHGRFVLRPDGMLCHSDDPEHGVDMLPDGVRLLTRRQMAETWTLVRELGLADPQSATPPSNPLFLTPAPEELLYLLTISGDSRRWMETKAVSDDAGAPPTAMDQLARHLSRLAWRPDEFEVDRPVTIRRYDFGPDPYERYRR